MKSAIPSIPGILAALVLGGCVSSSPGIRVRTQSDETLMPREVRRLVVINQLSRAEDSWGGEFSRHMQGYLDRVGLAFEVQTRSPLDVESQKRTYAAEIRQFQPAAVLVVEPGPGIITPGGRYVEHTFEAGLMPYPPAREGVREVVWKSRITLKPAGFEIGNEDLKALAASLMRAMINDGVLPAEPVRGPIPAPTPLPAATPAPTEAPDPASDDGTGE